MFVHLRCSQFHVLYQSTIRDRCKSSLSGCSDIISANVYHGLRLLISYVHMGCVQTRVYTRSSSCSKSLRYPSRSAVRMTQYARWRAPFSNRMRYYRRFQRRGVYSCDACLHAVSKADLFVHGFTSNRKVSPASSQTSFNDLVSPDSMQKVDSTPHSPLLLQRQLQTLRSPSKLIIDLPPPHHP